MERKACLADQSNIWKLSRYAFPSSAVLVQLLISSMQLTLSMTDAEQHDQTSRNRASLSN